VIDCFWSPAEATTREPAPHDVEAFLLSRGAARSVSGHPICQLEKFRKPGFIDYNGGLKVNHPLLSVVLHD
jgi:hypothetical protein